MSEQKKTIYSDLQIDGIYISSSLNATYIVLHKTIKRVAIWEWDAVDQDENYNLYIACPFISMSNLLTDVFCEA